MLVLTDTHSRLITQDLRKIITVDSTCWNNNKEIPDYISLWSVHPALAHFLDLSAELFAVSRLCLCLLWMNGISCRVTCPALRAICTATSKHSLQSSIANRRVTVIRARFSASHCLSGTLTSGSVFTAAAYTTHKWPLISRTHQRDPRTPAPRSLARSCDGYWDTRAYLWM